jgi:hypothetical protein
MDHQLRFGPGLIARRVASWRRLPACPPARVPGLILAGVVVSVLLAACGSGSSSPTPAPGSLPVTFVYVIDGPDAGVAHTTHLQVLNPQNALLRETTLGRAGTVDTGTIFLLPGNYSAISWDEEPASPSPVISTKCGSPFTVDPGQALVVTIIASRIGACLTDTAEPGASQSPDSSLPTQTPPAGPS